MPKYELFFISVSFFDETLKKALGEDKQIILDFKNVEFIASAVLRVLLTVEKKLKLANLKINY